jgi:hypothetical protein
MWFIIFLLLFGFVAFIIIVVGLALSVFSAIGGYDESYDRKAGYSEYSRPELDLYSRGDTFVDARSVHLHSENRHIEGVKRNG